MADPTSGILDNYNLRYNWGTGTLEMNTGEETWAAIPGTQGSPGGNNAFIQFNNNGAFDGDTNLQWDAANTQMFIGNGVLAYDDSAVHGLNIHAQIDDFVWIYTTTTYGIFLNDLLGRDNIGVGTNTPVPSAVLDIVSLGNNTGVTFPRMTSAQRAAISNPAEGLMVYDTNLHKICVFTTAWEAVTSTTI